MPVDFGPAAAGAFHSGLRAIVVSCATENTGSSRVFGLPFSSREF